MYLCAVILQHPSGESTYHGNRRYGFNVVLRWWVSASHPHLETTFLFPRAVQPSYGAKFPLSYLFSLINTVFASNTISALFYGPPSLATTLTASLLHYTAGKTSPPGEGELGCWPAGLGFKLLFGEGGFRLSSCIKQAFN